MKRIFLIILSILSLQPFASTGELAGKYVGELRNGSECVVNLKLESDIIGIGYNDEYFNMRIKRSELEEALRKDPTTATFKRSADFSSAKVTLYLERGKLKEADMKISFLPSFSKRCYNLERI